jgi:hypothetical protein
MKHILLLLLVASSAFITAGCGITAKYQYPARNIKLERVSDQAVYKKTVAVPKFIDLRPEGTISSSLLLCLIPLVPYSWCEYERVEDGKVFNVIQGFAFDPQTKLAESVVHSLKASYLFDHVFFSYNADTAKADYILQGTLRSTYFKARCFSYCIAPLSAYLWVLGAPNGTATNRLAFDLELKDKQGNILWTYTYDNDDWEVEWIYTRPSREIRRYSILMTKAMNQAVNHMSRELPGKLGNIAKIEV